MNKEQLINLTEEYLKSVPDLKKRIRLISSELKNKNYDMATTEKLQQEKNKLDRKLSRVIRSIGKLKYDNQRILCYRYIENLSLQEIAKRIEVSSHNTVSNRIKNKLLLDVGRIMFGFEEEFFNKIYFDD